MGERVSLPTRRVRVGVRVRVSVGVRVVRVDL